MGPPVFIGNNIPPGPSVNIKDFFIIGPPVFIGNNIPPGPSVNIEDIFIIGPWSTSPCYTGYYARQFASYNTEFVTEGALQLSAKIKVPYLIHPISITFKINTIMNVSSTSDIEITFWRTWALTVTHEACQYTEQKFIAEKTGGDPVIPSPKLDTDLVMACDQLVDCLIKAYNNPSGSSRRFGQSI
ncbi:uncharacterized protein EDB91DRAFT_1259968 [Suillus paluster]|uniref:uncharacterized protein n=1 Tax=Suillus paluster TaxID=48578 RepID=UPI001B886684|nr:uncharacterized protein EDB91DRAFT_1259968 [Suillus paluster]KAG1717247.1 hypothetical protein EDB91DRAFT_1259968 [Suillus paluster]